MKRTLLGVIMTAGLVASTALAWHAPAAHADGSPITSCGMTDVNVTATLTDHHYDYSYGCYFFGSGFPLRVIADVTADYDVTDQTASESIHAHYAGEEYVSTWNCPSDPWAADGSEVACSVHYDHLTGDQQHQDLVQFWGCYSKGEPDWTWQGGQPECPGFDGLLPGVGPISVPIFSDPTSVHVLAAQLQNALKQVNAADLQLGRIPASSTCLACVLAGTSASSSATAGQLPAPSGFSGQRDDLFGATDILSWQSVPGTDYYRLSAQSHENGTPLTVSGGEDIAQAATTFVVSGTAAQVQGGTDFFLQACSLAGGCGTKATTTVVGP